MDAFIQNERGFDADNREALEHVVGHQLDADQHVVNRVIDAREEPSQTARNEALARAAGIARRGRANVAAHVVAEDEVDAAIDETIRHVRSQKRNG
jgi:hypothetical protein